MNAYAYYPTFNICVMFPLFYLMAMNNEENTQHNTAKCDQVWQMFAVQTQLLNICLKPYPNVW